MKTKIFFRRRLLALIVDLLAIYSCTCLLQALVWAFTYISFFILFFAVCINYYYASAALFGGQTAGRFLAGITLLGNDGYPVKAKALLIRELVLKGLFCILVPFYMVPLLFPLWSVFHTAVVGIIVLVISLLFLFIAKRQWWDVLSRSTIVRYSPSRSHRRAIFRLVTATAILSLIVITYPFTFGHQPFQKTYGVKYPVTGQVKNYSSFIKQHSQDPVDYIFTLFKTHDIVVLSERIHSEYTQYDFIKKLVTDPRFTKDVGNLFTECGSISFQDTLNTYLKTNFESGRLLDSNTAILQRNSNAVWPLWTNTNLFDLLKTVNGLNAGLPDSNKTHWYFTDLPVDWQTMTHKKFIEAYTMPKRDSLMAAHIIAPHNSTISSQRRHKALVIMNSRHGYGLVKENVNANFSREYYGTTAFLVAALRGKVANVMINTISIRYGYMMTPVQNGKWDRAFELAGNTPAGFNFNNSPFGEDVFDAGFFQAANVRYKDVFTGFVFYKPLEEHIQKDGFPFEFDRFEDTILRRAALVSKSHADNFHQQIAYYKQNSNNPVQTGMLAYAAIYNLVTVGALSILLLLWWITSLLAFLFGAKIPGKHTPAPAQKLGSIMNVEA